MNIGVVIVCAGRGLRLKNSNKSILKIGGKSLFAHSLKTFQSLKVVKQIVLVFRKPHLAKVGKTIKDKRVVLTEGGLKRSDSVYKGLLALSPKINSVLIHDGARPLVTRKSILKLIKALKNSPAVILAQPATDTLKLVEGNRIKKTLCRDKVFYAQTPQGFRKGLIVYAYKKLKKRSVTDDAQVVELLGHKVKVVPGDSCNIKITRTCDLKLAQALLKIKS